MRKMHEREDEELHGRAGLQGLVLQELMAAMDDYSADKHPKVKRPPEQANPDSMGGMELSDEMDPRLAAILKKKKGYC